MHVDCGEVTFSVIIRVVCICTQYMNLCIQAYIHVFLPDERSNLTDKVTVEPHLDFEHASYTCQGHSSKTTVAINQVSCGIMVQCLMSIGDYGSNFILLT